MDRGHLRRLAIAPRGQVSEVVLRGPAAVHPRRVAHGRVERPEDRPFRVATGAELDTLIADRFRTTFQALEAAFATRFEQLFGGGFARLSLTDPSDLGSTG